jgi:hypothetical protein
MKQSIVLEKTFPSQKEGKTKAASEVLALCE